MCAVNVAVLCRQNVDWAVSSIDSNCLTIVVMIVPTIGYVAASYHDHSFDLLKSNQKQKHSQYIGFHSNVAGCTSYGAAH